MVDEEERISLSIASPVPPVAPKRAIEGLTWAVVIDMFDIRILFGVYEMKTG